MVSNVLKLTLVFMAISGAVLAANMFTTSPASGIAADGVMIAGLAIFSFILLISVGGIVGGIIQAIVDWRESRQEAEDRRALTEWAARS